MVMVGWLTQFALIGTVLMPGWAYSQETSEALGALVKADIEKWWPIIKAADIKGD